MDIEEKLINMFEGRIMRLITITDITKFPQWTDTDIIAADYLLKEYRKLISIKINHENEPTPYDTLRKMCKY